MEKDPNSSRLRESWASGEAYEAYVGRWSRLYARQFLSWLDVPTGSAWLDVGCGTGALTSAILESAAPREVKGIDASDAHIAFVQEKVKDARASFQTGNAQALPVKTGAYDAVVSGFVLNFIPDLDRAAAEMARVTAPGGCVAAYVWDYASRMQFMRHFWNAAAALDPSAADLDEGRRFSICNPEPLAELFTGSGLNNVDVQPIDMWTVFKDFDDYWLPFLGGQGTAPTYTMSLSEQHRGALRERLHISLPSAVDGSIPLMSRAWAVKGMR